MKDLPKHPDGTLKREFPANGNKYIIRYYNEGLSLERFTIWQQFSLTAGFGLSFQQFYDNISSLKVLLNEAIQNKRQFIDSLLFLDAMEKGITDIQEARYPMAFYLASLFISRDGEDVTTWSTELADEKIHDWNTEGYNAESFLVFALEMSPGYKAVYQKLLEKETGAEMKTLENGGLKVKEKKQLG